MEARRLENLYREHGALVLRRARRLLQNEAAARDVMQDVFVRVIRAEKAFWEAASPVAWLYQATTHECLNWLRNHHRRAAIDARRPSEEARAQAPGHDERLSLIQLLSQVPEELREIAVYYYVDQLTHAEIAELLGVARRTVGNRIEAFLAAARSADLPLPEDSP